MSEEKNSNMFSNAKLSTIFIVVLGLHVVVIVLISAYHLLKGDTSAEITQRITPPEPRSYESVLTEEADERSPEVITAYDAVEVASTEESMEQAGLPLPMPAANDPIWTGQAPVAADVTPKMTQVKNKAEEVVQAAVTDTTTFRPAPVVTERVEPIQQVKEVAKVAKATAGAAYTVQKGDTLSAIASRYGVKVAEIQQANQLNSSMIRIGQKLTLPGVNALAMKAPQVTQAAKQVAPKAAVASTGTYTVSKGDTLWKISRKFSTTPQAIASLNGIKDPSKLRVGDKIKVPNTASSAARVNIETTTDMAMMPTR